MKSKYEQVLDLFLDELNFEIENTSFTSYLIPEENTIDFIYATDGRSLCRLPMNLVPANTPYKTLNRRELQDFFNKEFNMRHQINANELKNRIVELEREPVKKTCSDCEGTGVVDVCYQSKAGLRYSVSIDCPICNGEGELIDYDALPSTQLKLRQYARLGKYIIDTILLEKLVLTADLLQEEIFLVYQAENQSMNIFMVGEALIILMPISKCNPDQIKFTLSLEEEVNE